VATWAKFANAEPDLAAFAWERMEGRIVYQATLRLDGGPRVHPVSPWLGAGLLCVSFRDTSPKMREVARDARYALHTALPWEDTPANTASSSCADGSNRSLRRTRR
jgi:hypothetical protein